MTHGSKDETVSRQEMQQSLEKLQEQGLLSVQILSVFNSHRT